MGIFDRFKKSEDAALDPLKDLVLSKLKPGYVLDYDMKSWQVTAYNKYDFEEGDISEEWELTSGNDKWYLERSEDDDISWSLSRKIPVSSLEGNIRQHIIDNEDPPQKIRYDGTEFYLEDSGAAYFIKGGNSPRQEFIYWEFIDESTKKFISIEQWGETEFEAATGHTVEEYQFTNILPAVEN